jgi:hypothetical protein
MNVLGAFPFRIIAFYHHLFGHRAGDTLINTLLHNQSSRKSSVLTAKILLGLPFEHVPFPLSDMLVPRKKHLLWSVAVTSLTSVTFLSTSLEMNVLGAFPFRIIAFYHHLFGHRAGVAVFLALNLLNIESAMRPFELTKFNIWSCI